MWLAVIWSMRLTSALSCSSVNTESHGRQQNNNKLGFLPPGDAQLTALLLPQSSPSSYSLTISESLVSGQTPAERVSLCLLMCHGPGRWRWKLGEKVWESHGDHGDHGAKRAGRKNDREEEEEDVKWEEKSRNGKREKFLSEAEVRVKGAVSSF